MASDRPLLSASPPPPPLTHLPGPLPEPPLRLDPFAPSRRRSRSRPSAAAAAAADPDRLAASGKEFPDSDDARVVLIGDPRRTAAEQRGGGGSGGRIAGNAIRTAKYSPLTFLPRNLFEQFRRLAYVYFLAIAVLNQLPQLAVFGRGASLLPLAFVLFVTALKDAFEDLRRHRSDRLENNRSALVLLPGPRFLPKPWKSIRVGDVVKLLADDPVPADMVLLSTSDPSGLAYVRTTNLDGESNLKTRYARQETSGRTAEDGLAGVIRCERPNRNIYGFHGNLEIGGRRRVSLGPSNIVLRGCELKNTAWAVGVVVYADYDPHLTLYIDGAGAAGAGMLHDQGYEFV